MARKKKESSPTPTPAPKPKKTKKRDHCWHSIGMSYSIGTSSQSSSRCCQCGETFLKQGGYVTDEGHGPWVAATKWQENEYPKTNCVPKELKASDTPSSTNGIWYGYTFTGGTTTTATFSNTPSNTTDPEQEPANEPLPNDDPWWKLW